MLASDIFRDVLNNLRRKKLRTWLTVSGVAIGIFTVCITLALATGIKNFLAFQIRTYGNTKVIQVYLKGGFNPERLFTSRMGGLGKTPKPLTNEANRFDIKFLNEEKLAGIRALPGVVSVGPYVFCVMNSVRLADSEVKFDIVQIPFVSGEALDLAAGKHFSTPTAHEVILSYSYIEAFGGRQPEDLLGKQVIVAVSRIPFAQIFLPSFKEKIQEFPATIVGFIPAGLISTAAYFPEVFAEELGRFSFGVDNLFTAKNYGFVARVVVADEQAIPQLKPKIEAQGFHAVSILERVDTLYQVFRLIQGLLSLFGIIALVVAALGIINTLMMAIHERKREIGVMKAVGATQGNIMALYAAEAATIGSLGSLLGIAIALFIGHVANLFAAGLYPGYWKAHELFAIESWWLLPMLMLFGGVIGLCAGLYPASQAARLDPIRALKAE